jgi:hypothetical protein
MPEMIDVVNKKCLCGKRASYGLPGESPTCCKECKMPEMIDVKNKKCLCGKQMSFGLPGESPTCCVECKTDEMVNVKDKMCPCGKRPSYGLPGKLPTCCKECKTDKMIDVKNKKCPGYNSSPCAFSMRLYDDYEYCIYCDPGDDRRRIRKVDEEAFFEFLTTNGVCVTQREFRIDYRCVDTDGKYSLIDGIIITKDIVICLEVDEEAHAHYDPVCEQTRMNNATAEMRLEYSEHCIAWVRINPNILNKNDKRDRTSKGYKVRDRRHQEALDIIKELIITPNDCVKYIGY